MDNNSALQDLYEKCKAIAKQYKINFITAKAPPTPNELSFKWEEHYTNPVLCKIMPREIFRDQPVKPEVEACRGCLVNLVCLWEQNSDDKYPGEYALGPYHPNDQYIDIVGSRLVFNRMDIDWISSLDVVILQTVDYITQLDSTKDLQELLHLATKKEP